MKSLLIVLLTFLMFSCSTEEPKQVYETEIKTYIVSSKEEGIDIFDGKKCYIYFQTPTSTERTLVNEKTYNDYEVGDTIKVLVKYWERPPKKSKNPNSKNF